MPTISRTKSCESDLFKAMAKSPTNSWNDTLMKTLNHQLQPQTHHKIFPREHVLGNVPHDLHDQSALVLEGFLHESLQTVVLYHHPGVFLTSRQVYAESHELGLGVHVFRLEKHVRHLKSWTTLSMGPLKWKRGAYHGHAVGVGQHDLDLVVDARVVQKAQDGCLVLLVSWNTSSHTFKPLNPFQVLPCDSNFINLGNKPTRIIFPRNLESKDRL